VNEPDPTLPKAKPSVDLAKLNKRLHRQAGQAIVDFNMIEEGDKVMVCVSGGKDSYALLDILINLKARAPIHFDLVAVNLDQKQPGFPEHVLPEYLAKLGIPFHIENQDTYSIVKRVIPEGKTMWQPVLAAAARHSLPGCRRTRRDQDRARPPPRRHAADAVHEHVLRRQAQGHAGQARQRRRQEHRDPPARLRERAGPGTLGAHRKFPIIPCTLCGSQENLQRVQTKQMLREWDRQYPGRVDNMFNAMANVVPSHLMDRNLYPFASLEATGVAAASGDRAFDDDDCAAPATIAIRTTF